MKYLKKYNDIMARFRAGEFGDEVLSLDEILERAGEPDLFEKMTLSEIRELMKVSGGMTRRMFSLIEHKVISQLAVMEQLESDLKEQGLDLAVSLIGLHEELRERKIHFLKTAVKLPFEIIEESMEEFENALTEEEEHRFVARLAEELKQDEDTVLKRLLQVRRFADYLRNKTEE